MPFQSNDAETKTELKYTTHNLPKLKKYRRFTEYLET